MPTVIDGREREPVPAVAIRRPALPDLAAVRPETWLVVAITIVAALIRFATVTSQSFWIDEATTVHEVGLPLGAMFHAIRLNETTPPLYFVAAWAWSRVFGSGELGLRSLSVLAGTLTVPVAYLCARELVTRRAGVVAAALAAVCPFMIWYSQEARSYALFGLFSGLSVLFWARSLRTRRGRDLVLWGAASALAVLTHFFAGFLVAPEALWLLWRLRSRGALAAVAGVGLVQLAVLPLAIGDTTHPLNWITQFPLSVRIEQIPVTLALAELYKSPELGWGLPVAGALALVAAGLLAWGGEARERRGALAAAALAACVILIPIVLAEAGRDYVFARNLMPAWIPLAVLLGAACTAARARRAGAVLAAILLTGFVWGSVEIAGNPAYQRPDWRGAAQALGTPRVPRVILAYDGNAAEQPLSVYLPGTTFSYSGMPRGDGPVTAQEIDVVGDAQQAVPPHLPAGARLLSQTTVGNGIRVVRVILGRPWRLTPAAFATQAPRFLGPAWGATPSVLVQR